MSAADEQAREVEVVARVARDHGSKNANWINEGRYDSHWHCGADGCEWSDYRHPNGWDQHVAEQVHAALEPIRAAEREEAAREAVAALELTEEVDVDWCEYEGWWDPYRDGSGSWEKCKLPADHTKPHEGVDGGSWPRDLQDPKDQPKPLRRRLVGPWQDVPSADGVTWRSET